MASETFPYLYTSPQTHSWIFETLQVIIFWVRVTHKMLNLNWEKFHSIMISVTCHGFRNFPLFIHTPLYPFMNFQNPMSGVGWVIHGCGGLESYRGGLCSKTTQEMIVLRIKIWPNQNEFWKGYKIQVLNIKNYYYYYFIITIMLYSQLYQKIITRCSLYKKSSWHNYYVSSKRKKQKGYLCSQWSWNAFSKNNYKQKHAFSHIIQKAVDNNLSEEKTEHLTCDRWNYSHPTPFLHDPPHPTPPLHDPPHPTPTWPTPPLHDPPHTCMTHPTLPHLYMTHPSHPYMTHPTPPLHDPPHPCMTHPTPPHPCMTHPHPYMTHPTPAWHTPTPPHPTHPYMTHPTHPYMTHPTNAWPTPPLHAPPHPTSTWPTPPHPCVTHPTLPLHDPPHPTPGTFLGRTSLDFMGCFTMSPFR